MKKETKEIIKKFAFIFSPVFTLIMYVIPYVAYYHYSYKTINTMKNASYFNLLQSDIGVFTKVLLWASLVCVVASLVIYIASAVIKKKEKLLVNIASITLVASTGALFLFSFIKTSVGENVRIWADFMTFPYAALLIYNVTCLILNFKKSK